MANEKRARWVLWSSVIGENETIESWITSHFWNEGVEIKKAVPGTAIWYQADFANPAAPRAGMTVSLPPDKAADAMKWHDSVRSKYEKEIGSGVLKEFGAGIYAIENEQKDWGGEEGLRLCQEFHEINSRLLLDFAAQHEPLTVRRDKAGKVCDLVYVTMRETVPNLSKKEAADVLREWVGALASLYSPPLDLEAVKKTMPQIEAILSQSMSVMEDAAVSSNESGETDESDRAWTNLLKNYAAQIAPYKSQIEKNKNAIAANVSFWNWYGRRILHPNFNRTHLVHECPLLMGLASLIESGKLPWQSDSNR